MDSRVVENKWIDAVALLHAPGVHFVRSAYNGGLIDKSVRSVGVECLDESMTVQSEKDAADINSIVERFGVTGMMPVLSHVPVVSEFDAVFDFQTAQNAIRAAEEAFMELPASLRKRFDNDAGKFVDFCSNDANKEEMIKLGLVDKPVVPVVESPIRVEVVSPSEEKDNVSERVRDGSSSARRSRGRAGADD